MNRHNYEKFSHLQRKIYKNDISEDEKSQFHALILKVEASKNKCSMCEHNRVVGFRKIKDDSILERKCRQKNIITFNIEAIRCNSFKVHLI